MTRFGQSQIEPLAELGDTALGVFIFLFGGIERLFKRGELAAQRSDLLVENFDLSQRARGEFFLAFELAG